MALTDDDLKRIFELQQKNNVPTISWKHIASITAIGLTTLGASIYKDILEDIQSQKVKTQKIQEEFSEYRHTLSSVVLTLDEVNTVLKDPRFTEQNFKDRYWPTVISNVDQLRYLNEFKLQSEDRDRNLQESLNRIEYTLTDKKVLK